MSKRRVISRSATTAVRRLWGSRAFQHSDPVVSDENDPAQIMSVAIPTGREQDSVRLYAYHDIYGTMHFTTDEDIDNFYQNGTDRFIINPDGGGLIRPVGDTGSPDIWYRPDGMEDNWNQPRDNTKVEIEVPFFKVFNESAYQMLTIRFNHGGSLGGGDNYAEIKISPDITTGSPNQNQLNFDLRYVNYGVTQDTDSGSDLRKYPNYSGTDVAYTIQFWVDGDTDKCHVSIIGDYTGATATNLEVSSPPGVDYCDDSHIQIYSFFGDVENTSTARTQIDAWRILKGDDEGNRLVYYLSRDGGSNWTSGKIGDSWFTDGYDEDDISLSSLASGDKTLMLKIELRWPALVKGFGLAWGGD